MLAKTKKTSTVKSGSVPQKPKTVYLIYVMVKVY